MNFLKKLKIPNFNININMKDIALVLFGILLTVMFSQYVIPFFVKNIAHRNELLDVKLRIVPEGPLRKDLVDYDLRLENMHKDISLEDINVYINFQSVIDEEVLHHDIGILGLQRQNGESIKNSNHANIKIEKIFPGGVLIIDYFIRKEKFGKPPFRVWDLGNNCCKIEYSYNYLGATIRRKIEIMLPQMDSKNSSKQVYTCSIFNKFSNMLQQYGLSNPFTKVFFFGLGGIYYVAATLKNSEVLKMINFIIVVLIGCAIFLIFNGYKLRKQSKDIGASWQSWTLAVSLFALAATLGIAERDLAVIKKQISLQLRPFLVVINPYVAFVEDKTRDGYWMHIGYFFKNFGSQPAHEYQKKNELAILIKTPQTLFDNLDEVRKNPESSLTQKDDALLAIDKWRDNIMASLYEYLLNNPMANPEDIKSKFQEKGVSCFGSLYEYIPKPTVISPNQAHRSESNRDAGPNYGRELASGKEILVCYIFLTYESSMTRKNYSTYYMCYSDKDKYEDNADDKKGKAIPLVEYRQWMDREVL